jgi:hypothetical protein
VIGARGPSDNNNNCSLSKPFTAIGMALLHNEGRLDWTSRCATARGPSYWERGTCGPDGAGGASLSRTPPVGGL